MHDTEQDTVTLKDLNERFSDMLADIGVESDPHELGAQKLEGGDYYSRIFSQTPRMVTNRGTITIHGANIDMVQIVQKG